MRMPLKRLPVSLVQYKIYLRAMRKIRANLRLERNVLNLTQIERQAIRRTLFQKPIWIPTKAIAHSLRAPKKENNIVNFYNTDRRTQSIEIHQTFIFIREILIDQLEYNKTSLFQLMSEGKESNRALKINQTRFGQCGDDPYHAKCLALIKSIKQNGFQAAAEANAVDPNILVAIADDGSLLHYKRGHHRLAIAHALKIEKIPVNVEWLSGSFCMKFVDKRRLWRPGYVARSISQCIDHAVQNAFVQDEERQE